MGNNFSYMIVEEQIINLYDKGLLTLEILDVLCEAYRGTDIDSGGSQDLEAEDGKSFEEIVVALVEPDFKPSNDPKDPWDYYEEFGEIRSSRWGWR